jgi:hypothetical protein
MINAGIINEVLPKDEIYTLADVPGYYLIYCDSDDSIRAFNKAQLALLTDERIGLGRSYQFLRNTDTGHALLLVSKLATDI